MSIKVNGDLGNPKSDAGLEPNHVQLRNTRQEHGEAKGALTMTRMHIKNTAGNPEVTGDMFISPKLITITYCDITHAYIYMYISKSARSLKVTGDIFTSPEAITNTYPYASTCTKQHRWGSRSGRRHVHVTGITYNYIVT